MISPEKNNIYFLLQVLLAIYILEKNKFKEVIRMNFYTNSDNPLPYTLNLNNPPKISVQMKYVTKREDILFSNNKSLIYDDINMNNTPLLAKKISSTLFGLKNLGITCFLVSIFQILLNLIIILYLMHYIIS